MFSCQDMEPLRLSLYPVYICSSLEPGSPLARKIISACKEGESQEDFDHVLDVVERGYQLVVNFAHTVTTRGRQDLVTALSSCSLWRFERSRHLTRLCQLSHN